MRATPPKKRHLASALVEGLQAFRVVVLTGPRQSGKTTLARQLVPEGSWLRLDDATQLAAAVGDPSGAVRLGSRPLLIDEIQRAGDPLVRAIKAAVDDDPTPGQFLITGSADFLTVPTISESLAGRAVFYELHPFTQGEIAGHQEGFLNRLVYDPESLRAGPTSSLEPSDYIERICVGGYPEVLALDPATRRRWFNGYVRTITTRDVVELTGARRATELPRLLRAVAARTAGELVTTTLHNQVGLGSKHTTMDYLSYLEMTYLITTLPAWSRNLTAKTKRHSKVYITDAGLAAALMAKSPDAISQPTDPSRGPLFETFVVNELIRQAGWFDDEVMFHHYRDRDGHEVDIVCELPDGRIAAVEVKAASSVSQRDARNLAWLRDQLGDQFSHGIILYTGTRPASLGDRITVLPLSHLWETSTD